MKKFLYPIIIVLMILMGHESSYAAFRIPSIDTPQTNSVIVDAPTRAQRVHPDKKHTGAGFSIAALCCGVAGLFVGGIPLGICAAVFGIIGITKTLKGMAIAGVALGVIDIIGALIVLAAVA